MFQRMSQGVAIRYLRTRHLGDMKMLADAGVELIRVWFNQRLQDLFNRQGYDEQGHELQQQVQRILNEIMQNMQPAQPEAAQAAQPEPAQPEPAQPEPAQPEPVHAAHAAQPAAQPQEKYEFIITEDEKDLLGEKGGLTERAIREAAARYNAEHSGSPIDFTDIEREHFGRSSATYMQHLRYQLEGNVRIINGVTGKVLFNK